MITELSRDELVALGARHRADYLGEQAGYTLEVATADGKALEELLPEGYIGEVREALAAVDAARKDKALMAAESKEATNAHHDAYREAKVFRRKVARRALRARRMGKAIPDGLIKIDQTHTGPGLVGQVKEMVGLLEANLPALSGRGANALVAKGKALAETLQTVDAKHEAKRLSQLPEAVQRFYMQKAVLYLGIKVIHDAGMELHADNHAAAARYNLSILYRNAGHRKPNPAPQPAPVTA